MASVKERIRAFILAELPWDEPADALSDDYPLLTRGVVDSLDTMRLLAFIEEDFGISVPDSAVTRENFCTLAALTRLVESNLS
jgi:acyl carrier protein